MIGVLRRTVVFDWLFDNLCERLLQSQLTLKMASAQAVETASVTNNIPSQESNHPHDLFQSRTSICWVLYLYSTCWVKDNIYSFIWVKITRLFLLCSTRVVSTQRVTERICYCTSFDKIPTFSRLLFLLQSKRRRSIIVIVKKNWPVAQIADQWCPISPKIPREYTLREAHKHLLQHWESTPKLFLLSFLTK